jgi:hypothetical protein
MRILSPLSINLLFAAPTIWKLPGTGNHFSCTPLKAYNTDPTTSKARIVFPHGARSVGISKRYSTARSI